MKKVLSVLTLLVLATPAVAAPVKGSDGPAGPTEAQQRALDRKAKEDEKAYKDALDRIPDPGKKSQDPWSKMR